MSRGVEAIKTQTWNLGLYQEADKTGILALNELQYGKGELTQEDRFDWLYSGNPAGQAIVPVAKDVETEQVIGFVLCVPMRLSFSGVPALCYLGVNILVHPDYRRQGIFSAILYLSFERCIKRGALFFYAIANPISVQGTRKLGFVEAKLPLLVRPLDIGLLPQVRSFNPVPRLMLNAAWQMASTTIWRPERPDSREGLQVSEETCFDESFDHFWQRVAKKYDIALIRDRAFLTWRFCEAPFHHYQILTARQGGELVGYAVLRCMEIRGVQSGLIIDFLVEPDERGDTAGLLLVEEATRRFQEAQMTLAGCLMLAHAQEYTILRRAGYVRCPEQLAPQTFWLVAKSVSPRISENFLNQIDRWFVTMANHDAV
jgi:GNAT superfamily N-acetyltransferase